MAAQDKSWIESLDKKPTDRTGHDLVKLLKLIQMKSILNVFFFYLGSYFF